MEFALAGFLRHSAGRRGPWAHARHGCQVEGVVVAPHAGRLDPWTAPEAFTAPARVMASS